MPNITISIDENLLKKGKEYVAKHKTSLNNLIRKLLQQTVDNKNKNWLDECFNIMDEIGADSKGEKWKREDLYDV